MTEEEAGQTLCGQLFELGQRMGEIYRINSLWAEHNTLRNQAYRLISQYLRLGGRKGEFIPKSTVENRDVQFFSEIPTTYDADHKRYVPTGLLAYAYCDTCGKGCGFNSHSFEREINEPLWKSLMRTAEAHGLRCGGIGNIRFGHPPLGSLP